MIELSNNILGRIKSASEYVVRVQNPNSKIQGQLIKREIKLRTERALRYANR